MAYKCVIVDDEELARELIETHLSQLDDFELIASCASAIEAHQVLQNESIDLIFMDIEMPLIKGTDFINGLKTKPDVIFTTAYRDYAIEGFELNAIDYLLKPIVFERFFKAIEKFTTLKKANLTSERKSFIYVQIKKKNVKLILDDILYIESIKDYIRIHLNNDKIMLKHGLTAFEEKLDDRFLRIHRSYLVNRDKVTAYTKTDVEIENLEIPIGDFYKSDVLKKIKAAQ